MTTTDTTTPKKKLTIALSEARPVTIVKEDWPIISDAKNHDGEVEYQANRIWTIKVRRHADGRTIVYGDYDTHWQNERCKQAGYLIETSEGEDAVIRAIRRVAGVIGDQELADAVIARLPAVELE
jgi:hypothetical protein